MAEDARGRCDIHAFGQRGTDFGHSPGRCFQAVQRRVQASCGRLTTRCTPPALDALTLAALTMTDQRMHTAVRHPIIWAGRVHAGVAIALHVLGSSPPALVSRPRLHAPLLRLGTLTLSRSTHSSGAWSRDR